MLTFSCFWMFTVLSNRIDFALPCNARNKELSPNRLLRLSDYRYFRKKPKNSFTVHNNKSHYWYSASVQVAIANSKVNFSGIPGFVTSSRIHRSLTGIKLPLTPVRNLWIRLQVNTIYYKKNATLMWEYPRRKMNDYVVNKILEISL